MIKLELLQSQVKFFQNSFTDEDLTKLCWKHWNKDSELSQVLMDVEFHEGGKAWVTTNGEFWVSGDNGVQELSLELLLSL